MENLTPPALVSFLANLPAVEGPTPNVDIMLSICLQSDLPTGQSVKTGIPTQVQSGKAGIQAQLPAGSAPATSELSGSSLTLFQVAYLGNQEVIDNMGKGRNQTSSIYADVFKTSNFLSLHVYLNNGYNLHLSDETLVFGWQDDDDTTTVRSQPLPRDAFRIRQYQKARASSASQTGSVSYGNAFSGDLSGSTG
ncbi:hypothetical protein JHK85_012529 [Glycine max]|nr:hypothetical protein JHK85_012529 [Glycine max]KAG5057199.1 hypothetical protein JHK86_012195 [Glycine max]